MHIVLSRMERDRLIELPPLKHAYKKRSSLSITHTPATGPQEEFIGTVGSLPPLSVCMVTTKEEHALLNEYIDRYHYLGYSELSGAAIKYFFYAGERLVALMGFSASAWRMKPRQLYIGWNEEQRKHNLHLVTNQSRFLILPWINCKNLASELLSLIAK